MIESVGVLLCSIDNRPYDRSPAFKKLVKLQGMTTALESTYWSDIPLPKAGEKNEKMVDHSIRDARNHPA